MGPLHRTLCVSANASPVQGPITETHQCLIHEEQIGLEPERGSWPSPAVTANSQLASVSAPQVPVPFLCTSFPQSDATPFTSLFTAVLGTEVCFPVQVPFPISDGPLWVPTVRKVAWEAPTRLASAVQLVHDLCSSGREPSTVRAETDGLPVRGREQVFQASRALRSPPQRLDFTIVARGPPRVTTVKCVRLHSHETLFVDTDTCILYNFQLSQNVVIFKEFFKPFRSVRAMLGSKGHTKISGGL